jgi:phosphomannomutase
VDSLGEIENDAYMDIHIDEVLNLPLVDVEAVKAAKFKVVGGGFIRRNHHPKIIRVMGVEVVKLYCEPNGHFHNGTFKRAPN